MVSNDHVNQDLASTATRTAAHEFARQLSDDILRQVSKALRHHGRVWNWQGKSLENLQPIANEGRVEDMFNTARGLATSRYRIIIVKGDSLTSWQLVHTSRPPSSSYAGARSRHLAECGLLRLQ